MHKYAFFDVNSLELSPNGRTYVCHPHISAISEEIFETYSLMTHISAPLVFSVDAARNTPDKNKNRRDFLPVPVSKNEQEWKHSVNDRYKFYLQREPSDDKVKNSIFNNNENAIDCIKLMNAKVWFVFGNGIHHNINHVIESLLGAVNKVKFIPELIVPGENESDEELSSYFHKWEAMGAIPVSYNSIFQLAEKKPKFR